VADAAELNRNWTLSRRVLVQNSCVKFINNCKEKQLMKEMKENALSSYLCNAVSLSRESSGEFKRNLKNLKYATASLQLQAVPFVNHTLNYNSTAGDKTNMLFEYRVREINIPITHTVR